MGNAINDLNRVRRDKIASVLQHGVALLLTVAASLKAYAMFHASWEMALWPRWFGFALIELELSIALLLLLNRRPALGWGLAVAAFTIFAGVSAKNAAAGAKGCGCFGVATIDPKLMALLDLLIVVALIVTGPRLQRAARVGRIGRGAAVTILILMLAGLGATVYSAIPKRGLVADENGLHDFGQITSTAAGGCEHEFVLRNTASQPLRITKSTSSCGCTTAQLSPEPIPPGGSTVVKVRANWSKAEGTVVARVVLYTDSRWTPQVELLVNGQVTPGSGTATAPTTGE